MAPATIYLNTATNPFGDHATAILLNRWAVFNAPRPIPGEITFQGEFRHGIFYAAGPLEQYAQVWTDLDAWPVELISNIQIVDRLSTMAADRHTTLAEILEYTDLPNLARQCGFPWYDVPTTPESLPARQDADATAPPASRSTAIDPSTCSVPSS
jgi:hypothetical protein